MGGEAAPSRCVVSSLRIFIANQSAILGEKAGLFFIGWLFILTPASAGGCLSLETLAEDSFMKKGNSAEGDGAACSGSVVAASDRIRELEASNRQLRSELAAQAETASLLLASERKYRDLVDSAIDGVCILHDQVVTYVNPQLCEMLGVGKERLIGTSFVDHLVPEEKARTANLYRRMTSREAFPQRYETVLLGTAGVRLDVEINATQAVVDGKQAVVVVVHDISGQKMARQMAIENERLEAVRTMARGVGNNFSNILSVINSYAASIADSFLPNTRPHESAMKILDAVRHAGDLTKRLLGVVRVSGSFADAKVQPVEVGSSVRKACELVAPTLKDRGIVLDLKDVADNLYVKADSGQLLDSLMNILLNGADAMPQGGRLSICSEECSDTPGWVAVSVADTGIGMSPLQVSKAFEPFFTTKADRDAFGLGLSVAQSMVRSWGGRIELSSKPDVGTCVKLFMLRAEAPPCSADSGSRRTILVVDDHDGRRRMMRKALEASGHTVIEASGGTQAIAMFQERAGEIDLTVLDWIMPGVDGRDVLRVIHAHDPECRVLMTSGFSRDYVRSQIRMGAWTFLQKPFSADQFDEAVRKALGMTMEKRG